MLRRYAHGYKVLAKPPEFQQLSTLIWVQLLHGRGVDEGRLVMRAEAASSATVHLGRCFAVRQRHSKIRQFAATIVIIIFHKL